VTYTVTNTGQVDTVPAQGGWADRIYLSRDTFLDEKTDRYLGQLEHTGGLAKDQSYTRTVPVPMPRDVEGPFFVIVIADPVDLGRSRGVFEANELDNDRASDRPVLVELPPPAELVVTSVELPAAGSTVEIGQSLTVRWTVQNEAMQPAKGTWTDAVYLSADPIWDINDPLLGRKTFTGTRGKDETYQLELMAPLPPVKPGDYHVIVRTDIFNEIRETFELNNRRPSPGQVTLSATPLHVDAPLTINLASNEERLYQINVTPGQTLRVRLMGLAVAELFLRHGDLPSGTQFDASSGPAQANAEVIIPSTEAGDYLLLVRAGHNPDPTKPLVLEADYLPFGITNVTPDVGGAGRYVTVTIHGAQFQPGPPNARSLVKLVRPGFAEFTPERHEVINGTKIIAVFDLRGAPHGLYDVEVINPDGARTVAAYRYRIERALEPDVTIGLDGPRVLSPGDTGLYGVTLQSQTNVDVLHVLSQFGVPELGKNDMLPSFNTVFDFVQFRSNLRGRPESPGLQDVPWPSLESEVNRNGIQLASGFVHDLPTGAFVGRNFTAATYPGLKPFLDPDAGFATLRENLYNLYPQLRPLLDEGPAGLDKVLPGLAATYQAIKNGQDPLKDIPCELIAFQFYVTASATVLTRDEYILHQTAEALRLRDGILNDPTATPALLVLASSATDWPLAYLAALEQVGLLRPVDEAPPIRELPR
jgi:hypothetical protein